MLKSLLCRQDDNLHSFLHDAFSSWMFPFPVSPLNADVLMLVFLILIPALLIPRHLYI